MKLSEALSVSKLAEGVEIRQHVSGNKYTHVASPTHTFHKNGKQVGYAVRGRGTYSIMKGSWEKGKYVASAIDKEGLHSAVGKHFK